MSYQLTCSIIHLIWFFRKENNYFFHIIFFLFAFLLSAANIRQDLVVILSRGLGVLLFSVCREKCMEVYKIKMNPPEGGGFKFRGSFKLYQRHCDYAKKLRSFNDF